MDKKEFMIIASAIKTYYPKDNILPTKESVSLWYDCLSDLQYQLVQEALKNYVRGNNYPPTIADIRNECQKIQDSEAEKRIRLREIFESTVALYPMANREVNVESTYKSILNRVEKKDRLTVANRIMQQAGHYVRECEKKNCRNILPMAEFLKGIDLNELLS